MIFVSPLCSLCPNRKIRYLTLLLSFTDFMQLPISLLNSPWREDFELDKIFTTISFQIRVIRAFNSRNSRYENYSAK